MITNPIIKGFNPDPAICRKGDDYYIAVSSFEWFPGIPVYHSKDMKNWELQTHVISDENLVDLKKLPSAKGIWAPCLTYCEQEDLFYVVYGVMNSMNGRYFDVDNYLITAQDINGPWSEPVYIHSAGYDASILHDDDGRKWIVSVEWEFREGYEGAICLVEYDPEQKSAIGYPKRVWSGATNICLEAPHLTKRNDYYYLMGAEGGTGYGHSVTMARSKNVWGPYENDPKNPIVTSVDAVLAASKALEFEKPDFTKDPTYKDYLRIECFNPNSKLQKSGHGSYVETPDGEVYMVHLCSRPFVPELRCSLGRETGIQKMYWTDDGWLRLQGDSNIAQYDVEPSNLPEHKFEPIPDLDHFDSKELGIHYYSPRQDPASISSLTANTSYLRIYGQESLCSLNKVGLIVRKLTSVSAQITTKLRFNPEVYQHSAGIVLYYDNMNYLYLNKHYDEREKKTALAVTHLENGGKFEYTNEKAYINNDQDIYLRITIHGKETIFYWSYDGITYNKLGRSFDTTKMSDEFSLYGEFTGTFVGMACVDSLYHKQHADFDLFEYIADDSKDPSLFP